MTRMLRNSCWLGGFRWLFPVIPPGFEPLGEVLVLYFKKILSYIPMLKHRSKFSPGRSFTNYGVVV
jgi:hypothetical protein